MLRVTIELVPHGVESAKRTLAVGTIVNTSDDPGRPAFGSYDVTLRAGGDAGRLRAYGRRGRVEGWPRRRHVWRLVANALQAALSNGDDT